MAEGRPPFIRNVSHNRETTINTPVIITLDADWPTPSWEHEDTIIKINKNDLEVHINYYGTRRAGVAMQVIKSFSVEFEISLPSPGKWKIIIRGRNEDWESIIKVS